MLGKRLFENAKLSRPKTHGLYRTTAVYTYAPVANAGGRKHSADRLNCTAAAGGRFTGWDGSGLTDQSLPCHAHAQRRHT